MSEQIYSIEEIKKGAVPIAQNYGLENMFLFGSYAKGTADAQSDIDFRIDKGQLKGFEIGGLYADLEDYFHKPIDLLTTASLSPAFLNDIVKEEVLLYGN